MIRKFKEYSLKTKLKVVQLVLGGHESVLSVSRKYQIGGNMTVYRWIAQFQDGILQPSKPLYMAKYKKSVMKADAAPGSQSLEQELEMLRLKVLAYETMIDIAERELGISIKKKSSAKQSPPLENNEETSR